MLAPALALTGAAGTDPALYVTAGATVFEVLVAVAYPVALIVEPAAGPVTALLTPAAGTEAAVLTPGPGALELTAAPASLAEALALAKL